MPTEPEPLTLSQLVRRAVEIVDPDGADDAVTDLLRRMEDADEPVPALVGDVEQRMAEETGVIDPEGDDPSLRMAGAVVVYLAHRRDEFDDDPLDILRLTARAEFDDNPPANVAQWLDEVGVEY
jgi:hypothetical protein